MFATTNRSARRGLYCLHCCYPVDLMVASYIYKVQGKWIDYTIATQLICWLLATNYAISQEYLKYPSRQL